MKSGNARRQAAYADRQKALGRKKISLWLREDEAERIKEMVRKMREEEMEESKSHALVCAGLADQYKDDPVLCAALTDAAAIINQLIEDKG